MPLYHELPPLVDAIQFNDWMDDKDVIVAYKDKFGILYPNPHTKYENVALQLVMVNALEDREGLLQEIAYGDYIIRARDGSKTVVKKKDFERKYREVSDATI
jgi:hypothetical protein